MLTTAKWALADSLVLIGRSIRHSARSIDVLITSILLPVLLLLMFVYVFGGAIHTGGRYIEYVVPGIVLLCAGFGSATTAVSVCQDMTTGAIDRFRALPIVSSALLTGHVIAGILRNLVTTLIVLVIALALGFDAHASVTSWLGMLGVLVLFMAAISWLGACFGLLARNVEAAGAFSFLVMFTPYVSSAFVPPHTMPGVLATIARHQPITAVTETLRALMLGTPAGGHAFTAVAWCVGGILLGGGGAVWLFRRRTAG